MTEQPETGVVQNLIPHLLELRKRFIRAAVAVLLVFVCLVPFAARLFDLLAAPMLNVLPPGTKMIAIGVVAPFVIPVKFSLLLAFLIALPYVLHQVWGFIAPGLYAHEKRLVAPLVISSTALFFAGVAFCYFVVFGMLFRFIQQFAPQSMSVAPDIESYYDFVLTMFMAFGLTFEVPVVVLVLARVGLVTIEQLKRVRPYVIVAAFVLAAIVTPPDAMSQLLLAIPLCLLYEIGLLVTPFFIKGTQRHSPPE